MGNSQSQSSDEDEGGKPIYRYHEDVLRNAQALTAKSVQVSVYESDIEEYFSAEEGDGDSERSITPPRTRPESSSGEEFSDDSADEREEKEQGDARQVSAPQQKAALQLSSMNPVRSPAGRVLRSNRTCGQCNVSRFEEHDSISPELETSRWHLSDSSVSDRMSTNDQRSPPSNITSNSVKSPQNMELSLSPFRPIQASPGSLNVSQVEGNSSFQRSSKRKPSVTPETGERGAPPTKCFSSAVSPMKRGIGYFDSSDSDSDAEGNSRGRRRRRSRHSRSPKQAKASVNVPTPGSKRSHIEQHPHEVEEDDRSLITSSKQRRIMDKKALQSVISESAKRCHSGVEIELESNVKRTRCQTDLSEEDNDKSPLRCQGDSVMTSSERIGFGHSAFQDHANVEEGKYQENTLKMGRNGMRNSLGKLMPVRGQLASHQRAEGSGQMVENIEVPERREYTSLPNISDNLRETRAHRTNDSSEIGQLKRKVSERLSPVSVDDSQDNSHEKERHELRNPLANVVLTPPGSPSLSRNSSYRTNSMSSPCQIAGTKRKKQSAAERFKTFWSEGSLGTNFKSLFSTKSRNAHGKSKQFAQQATCPSSSSPSSRFAHQSLSNDNLFNNSSHMFFSSSPAVSVNSAPGDTQSFRQDQANPHESKSSPAMNISSVSPIFASLPASSVDNRSVDRKSRRYLSILEMSAQARKRESQNQNASQRRTTPTRTSPRFQHSKPKPASSPANMPPSSAEIEILPQESQFQVLHFRLDDRLEISVRMGDIADVASAGIVNWTDESLTHTVTECSRQIAARAGALMRAGCNDYLTNKGGLLEAPDVLTTPAGGRFPRSVEALLHVVSPQLKRGEKPACAMTTRLFEVYANCLRFANERLGLQSLSLPLIGQDLFTDEVSIKTFFDSVVIFLTEGRSKSTELSSSAPVFDLTSISFVLSDAKSTDLAAELINEGLHDIATEGLEIVARNTFLTYYGEDHSLTAATENVERAKSGRPRVKRPKL